MKWILKESNISNSDIENMEQKLGISFPSDFKEVILKNNGSSPELNVFDTDVSQERVAEYLLSFNQDDKGNILDTYYSIKDRLPEKCIPVMSDPFGNYICFNFSNEDSPKLYFWDHENNSIEFISDDFTNFLKKLYTI